MRRGVQRTILLVLGLLVWPGLPGRAPAAPGGPFGLPAAEAAAGQGDAVGARDLASQPATDEPRSDLDLEQLSRAAAWAAAGFGALAFVLLIVALISRRLRRRRRVRRRSVYGVDLPRNRISG